jgi:hypothetical protein
VLIPAVDEIGIGRFERAEVDELAPEEGIRAGQARVAAHGFGISCFHLRPSARGAAVRETG